MPCSRRICPVAALGTVLAWPGAGGVPHNHLVVAVFDVFKNAIQHKFFLDARGDGDLVHDLVVGQVHHHRPQTTSTFRRNQPHIMCALGFCKCQQ